jgi:hypothetical protein
LTTKAGWADALGKQLAGDSDVWQRTRARGGKPFRVCADDVNVKGKRGGQKSARAKVLDQKLKLMPLEDDE